MMKNHHQDNNNESKSLLLPHSKKKNATTTNTAGNTSSSSSSSSSSLFVESLSKAFLVAVAIMGLSLCVQFREQHHHHLHRSQPPPPPQEGRTEEHRRKLLTDSTTSTSTGHHQWALDRGFGFPSAFEDSLYAASSSASSSLASLSSVMEESSMEQTCPPQRLHLTQATNVEYDKDNEDGPVVDMMLSLTLPYKPDCGGEDNNDKVQLTVVYGRGVYPEGSSSSSNAASDDEVIQFAYDASLAVPGLDDYQSDFIHHIALKGLQAGRQTYWYRVYVTEQAAPLAEKTKDDNRHYNAAARVLSKTLLSYSRNHPHYLVAATAASSTRNLRQQEESPQRNEADQRIIFLGDSMVHTFQTPPVAHQATSLALVGDLGQTENSTKTMQRILSKSAAGGLLANTYQDDDDDDDDETAPPVTALIIAGDLSYSDGDPRRWTSWLELMEPLLRSMPLFSVPGNHEIECDNTTHQVFGQYESYFRNPNRVGPADRQPIPDDYRRTLWSCLTSSEFLGHYNYGNAFWSVDHGLAKIIGLNSYTSTLPGSPQYLWLDHELKNNVDRSETPWLIVTFHCPLHTTFQGHNGEVNALLMLKSMEPLFVQYQVNFVVSGHDHAYLRTKPMQGTEAADDHDDDDKKTGPIYLTLGAGGNREQHNKGYIHDIPEDWVVKRDLSEYGFGHLHLPNATHAHLTWVRDGTTEEGIRDSVWLPNQYSSSSDSDSSQNDHYRLRSSEHQAEMKYSR